MKQYRGLYIDNVIFHSEAEIDFFLKEKAIQAFRIAVQMFSRNPSMEASLYAAEKAGYLNNLYGMDWDEIEAIEIEAMTA